MQKPTIKAEFTLWSHEIVLDNALKVASFP